MLVVDKCMIYVQNKCFFVYLFVEYIMLIDESVYKIN